MAVNEIVLLGNMLAVLNCAYQFHNIKQYNWKKIQPELIFFYTISKHPFKEKAFL